MTMTAAQRWAHEYGGSIDYTALLLAFEAGQRQPTEPARVLPSREGIAEQIKGYIIVDRINGRPDWDDAIYETADLARASFDLHGELSSSRFDYDIYALTYAGRADGLTPAQSVPDVPEVGSDA